MTPCLLALAIATGCSDPPATGLAPAVPEDAWLAEDKARHFGISFAATVYLFSAARLAAEPETARAAAAAATFGLGLGKEIHDHRTGGRFSLRDLVWDAAGIGAALLLVTRVR